MNNTLLPPEKMCLELPLYAKVTLSDNDIQLLRQLELFQGALTCYCIACGEESIFKRTTEEFHRFPGMNNPAYEEQRLFADHQFKVTLSCVRDERHPKAQFFFSVYQKQLIKIGQYPSLADLAIPEIKKYQKMLLQQEYKEFHCAIGLASHGIGIGAFVYLRRIFENLILEAKEFAKEKDTEFDEKKFEEMKMDSKIAYLQSYLPIFLVENRKIYGMLSLGIHALDENECLEAFPIIRTGIELIFDEKIKQREEQKKINAAKPLLNKLYEKLRNKK